MTPNEVLLAAAALIETGGLCKKMFSDGKGAFCAIGAIASVLDTNPYGPGNMPAIKLLADYVKADKSTIYVSVAAWSDASTVEDVVAGLRQAAEQA